MELTENGNFRLFAANGKIETANFVCFLQMETEYGSYFLGRQTINGNRRLLVTVNVPVYGLYCPVKLFLTECVMFFRKSKKEE
jgi:hypothetical protein